MPCSPRLPKQVLFWSTVSFEKSVKIPHVPLSPNTPLRTVMLGLWSMRTAARFAFEARRPSITT